MYTLLLRVGLLIATAFPSFAVVPNHNVTAKRSLSFVKGQVLVKLDPGYAGSLTDFSNLGILQIKDFSLVDGLGLYIFDPNLDVMEVIRKLREKAFVVYAEPDYIYEAQDLATVNDPEFPKQWALENKGQNGGKIDADINAETMWNYQKGSNRVVIGIIDTGIDFTHQDLVDNLWHNSLEIAGNGKDDDLNGYVDDIHGANAIKGNGNPMDDNVHGTHVAGTIGARGNNSLGVVGIAQEVQIAACKFLSSGGSGSTSDAIECMEYFANLKTRARNPVNLVATNNSWGGGGSSQALLDAVKAHERLGILFIAAAGNESANNDSTDSFPANYNVSNVISVAATDNNDRLASFSNYGKKNVHLAAPGVKILSTILGNRYGELSGTSMATPHVTGMTAIIASQFPDLNYVGIKNLILTGGQKIAAALGTTITGRRLRGADTGGVGSLTCNNQFLSVRLAPSGTTKHIALGESVFLSASHINCAIFGGPLTVHQGVTLKDDGLNGDVSANDGIYSLNWQPSVAGTYELTFSDSDVFTVVVGEDGGSGTYVANDQIPFEYISIGGQRLHAGDDTMHFVTAPFPIRFSGQDSGYLNLFVSSNGTISFTDRIQPGYQNRNLPMSSLTTVIAPYWDDLITVVDNSDIFVEVIGSAPNRRFIVEWWRIKHYSSTGLGAFQVVFYEDSSDIRFNYLDTNFSNSLFNFGASATVGVQSNAGVAAVYSFNQARVGSQKSILFSLQ